MADLIAEFGLVAPPAEQIAAFAALDAEISPLNTTIAVVATDAALSAGGLSPRGRRRARRSGAHHPAVPTRRWTATPCSRWPPVPSRCAPDPDTPASMSPETKLVTALGAAAADCLARAVLVGVLAAESVAGIPTYRDMLPGAFASDAD